MKLEKFVTETLLEITKGVEAAKVGSNLSIAPGRVEGELQLKPSLVSFEVAVTTNADGEAGISVLAFGKLEGKIAHEYVNRISFNVPVYFQAKNTNGI